MKRSRTGRLMLMGIAPLALAACDSPQYNAPPPADTYESESAVEPGPATEQASLYGSLEECVAGGIYTELGCKQAMEQAQTAHAETAPRYSELRECIAIYGEDGCRPQQNSDGTSFFVPLMAGFMIGNMLDSFGRRTYYQPVYRDRDNSWRSGNGYALGRSTGNIMVPKQATLPQQRAITQSRSGFGSRAAARGSWGG